MRKAVSLYLPHWSADLILRSCDRRETVPVVLLYVETGGRRLIARCCAQAAAAGVRPQMTLTHARAILPRDGVIARLHKPLRESATLGALARWALRFSPIVAVDPPDGLLIDISGCERLFGGERRLLDLIRDAVGRLGFGGRVAAAPTFACAWAVARYGEHAIVAEGEQRDVLSTLPIEALRVEPSTVDALHEVGIERIGHLLDLPRSSLATRLGPELLVRLDQALGRAVETIDPVRPVVAPVVERVFAGPVKQLEAIELTVRELIDELAAILAQRECGARRIDLCLERLDVESLSVTVTLSRPSRDVGHLWSLLRTRVESINLGWGVECVRLAAPRVGRLVHEQAEQWANDKSSDRGRLDRLFGELLDTLSNRLGPDRVTRIEPVQSHVPERAFRLRPATETTPGVIPETPALADRPSLLFERPEPITVIAMTPEGPPLWFRWRGRGRRITASVGPERIAAEWWGEKAGVGGRHKPRAKTFGSSYARAYEGFWRGEEKTAQGSFSSPRPEQRKNSPGLFFPTRDYFRIQDELGRWLWIYRALGSDNWFVHGLWA